MRRVRRKRILRRLVLGLAVAAIVAPAAQARPDEGRATQGKAAGPAAVIRGDDKVIVTGGDGSGALIHGDDKVLVPRGGAPATLIHDDKVIVPRPGDYTLAGYRRALPDDYGLRAVVPVEAVRGPSSFDWGDALAGAGAAFGLMLLIGGAALATRHVRPTAA
ncbi:MAG: hypothetical protein ACREJR_00860 [Candidatus Rokuibacteriota bacterium]